MPTHDIIDNRNELLVANINRILESTRAASFAVGYFFVSGLTAIADKLEGVKELRLLVGNTTNRETLEQMVEGYRRLELVTRAAESQAYPKRSEANRMIGEAAGSLRDAVELMDQTDRAENLVVVLNRMIEEQRLKVRVYTKGRLHAKAYIFDYGPIFDGKGKPIERQEKGIAVVGSSNLTLAGISHNTELNVVVHGNDNHAELKRWFDALWEEAQDFDEALMSELRQSWALATATPYDIYMKTLLGLVKDRLEGGDEKELLWDDEITRRLADFQKVAVKQAVQMIRDYGGAFISDVVGLGKSYIGAAIVKHFERTDHARPLIVCPASLVDMWERYNEVYDLNARVLSMGYLYEGNGNGAGNLLLDDVKYRDRDFVLVDESHNFRHPDTQRYKMLQSFMGTGRRCCLVTATPRNKTAWDIYNQLKLFHQDDKTDLPVDPPNLRQFFRMVERGEKKLPELLSNILIRRTRGHVLRWYGYDAVTHQQIDPSRFSEYAQGKRKAYVLVAGRHQFFPQRELVTIEYSIEDTYQGLYDELRGYLGKPRKTVPRLTGDGELTYARYGLFNYVLRDKQRQEPYNSLQRAGANLRGLMRVLLFKRFESSVEAFRKTVAKLIAVHESFLKALQQGIVAAGEEAQSLLYASDAVEEEDLLEALRRTAGRYKAGDFDIGLLQEHIQHDLKLLRKIERLVEPITADKDAKLQELKRRLLTSPLKQGKRLIFTQFADTAQYLFDNLNPRERRDDIDVIYSGDKSKERLVGRFAPKANPEYRFQGGESELMTVIATDVLAEGLNLQDCDKVINYDLHWNPVKLIQRFGRIDRIGSEHDRVFGFNFFPERGIDRNLGLTRKLRNRIQEIHDTIGEDSAILDASERLNEEAMYAIYEQKGGQLALFEDDEGKEDLLDLNEAEEIVRQLRADDPAEYQRIEALRDGIRSAKKSAEQGTYVFCEARSPLTGDVRYRQLLVLDKDGGVISRDVPKVLSLIRCQASEPAVDLPLTHNASVMGAKALFEEEVKNRWAEQKHSASLSMAQRYVLRELRVLFSQADDEDVKAQINLLAKVFGGSVTTAVKGELNRLRRNGVLGHELLKFLGDIYYRHGMSRWVDRFSAADEELPVSRIICSEALL